MGRPVAATLVAVGFCALTACQPAEEADGTNADYNLILISIDALRADHVGAYGYDRPTTPFLDRLAADSVVFERVWAPSSFTLQSVSALLTGRLPTSGGSVSLEAQPHENAETLARLFRAADFRTGMFSNQFLLGSRGFTRGFEGIQIFDAPPDQPEQTALEVTKNALRFIDDYAGERFMVYAHYVQPHPPYEPPAETAPAFGVDASEVSVTGLIAEIDAGKPVAVSDPRMTQLKSRYDAEIAAVDAAMEALVDGLAERGLADSTVIVVTGSQGQEFLEHGYLDHAWTLFEEQLRVPLVLHAPGLVEPQRVERPVSTIDVYPTLVDLFGLDLDVGAWQPDGSSLLGDSLEIRVLGEPRLAELVIRERCVLRAIVLDEWKYIAEYIPCPVERRGEIQAGYVDLVRAIAAGEAEAPSIWGEIVNESLFNLDDDPDETRNLLDSEPEQLAYLRERLTDYERYSELYALQAIQAVAAPEALERLCRGGYFGC